MARQHVPDPDPTGSWLYAVDVAVDPSVESDWNEWYDSVHLPEILACPGFLRSDRYISEDSDGQHRYLTIYGIEDPTALATPAFVSARGWYQFAADVTFKTRVYRRITEMTCQEKP
jgi:hypothetical protein